MTTFAATTSRPTSVRSSAPWELWLLGAIVFLLEIDPDGLNLPAVGAPRDVLVILALAAVGLVAVLRVRPWPGLSSSPVPLLLAWVGLGVLTSPISLTPFGSLVRSVVAVGLVVVVVAAVRRCGLEPTAEAIGWGLVALLGASLLWELIGPGTGSIVDDGVLDTGIAGLPRRAGLPADPNAFGRASVVLLTLGSVLHNRVGGSARWFMTIGALGALAAQSRTSLLAAVLVSVVMLIVHGRRDVVAKVALFALLGISGLAVAGELSSELLVREGSDTEELATATGRTDLWVVVWDLYLDDPLFGVGAFAAAEAIEPEIADERVWVAADAHNLLFNVALTQGAVGVVLFVGFLAATIVGWWRLGRPAFVLVPVLALTVLSITENTVRKPSLALAIFALVAGAVAVLDDRVASETA